MGVHFVPFFYICVNKKKYEIWKYENRLKSYHVGIHLIVLVEYSQMSTHVPGFQSFFRFFASFSIGKISHQQHKGWGCLGYLCPMHKKAKIFENRLKSYHVGIHLIVLVEYSQMSTHVPGFQSFFRFFASFSIGKISHQQHKGWGWTDLCSTSRFFKRTNLMECWLT